MRAHPSARGNAGFTLTELAVVLTIVALLLGSLMYTLSAQVEQRSFDETERRLEAAREALLGFALVNGRLPCPARYASDASHSGGLESFCPNASGACPGTETAAVQSHGNCSNFYDGFVPAKALGLQSTDSLGFAVDAWGFRMRYAVAEKVQDPGASCPATGATKQEPGFTSAANMKANGIGCLPDRMMVCTTADGATPTDCGSAAARVTGVNVVVAILVSPGKNTATTGGTGTDEVANANGDGVFVAHPRAPAGATGGEFDDMLMWIPVGVLYGRMISAGVLP
jgi:prepilin-type N-terminal cleavage/methylation domain-containing protein